MGQQSSVNIDSKHPAGHDGKYMAYRQCAAKASAALGRLQPGNAAKIRCELNVKPRVASDIEPANSELTSSDQAQILFDMFSMNIVVLSHEQQGNIWEIRVLRRFRDSGNAVRTSYLWNEWKMPYWEVTKK